jgi:hypothetical protein
MTGGLWSGPGPDHRPDRALPECAIDKLVLGLHEDQGSTDRRKVWGSASGSRGVPTDGAGPETSSSTR